MIYRTPKMKSIRKIHGGKSYLCRNIISMMKVPCDDFTFVDCTFGGGSVSLNVDTGEYPMARFVANDVDPRIVSACKTLSADSNSVLKYINTIECNRESFDRCVANDSLFGTSRIVGAKWAANYIGRYRMSRGGMGTDFAWSDRLRGGRPGDLNAWENFKEYLPRVADCCRSYIFENLDVLEAIRKYDSKKTVFYVDLPYPSGQRISKNIYDFEMLTYNNDKKSGDLRTTHEDVIDEVLSSRGQFYISSYHNDLYDFNLTPENGYEYREFDIANHSGQGGTKQRRIEVVWHPAG